MIVALLTGLLIAAAIAIVGLFHIAVSCSDGEDRWHAEADRLRRLVETYEYIDDVTAATHEAIRRIR
jgi:hypothetical protein